jgi:hypothetical protein
MDRERTDVNKQPELTAGMIRFIYSAQHNLEFKVGLDINGDLGLAAKAGLKIAELMIASNGVPDLATVGEIQVSCLKQYQSSNAPIRHINAITIAEEREKQIGQPLFLDTDPEDLQQAKLGVVLFGDLSQEGLEYAIKVIVLGYRLGNGGMPDAEKERLLIIDHLRKAKKLCGKDFPLDETLKSYKEDQAKPNKLRKRSRR